MRRVCAGLAMSLALSATAIAAGKDVTTQVVIRCDCVAKYPAWMCEAFGFFLC